MKKRVIFKVGLPLFTGILALVSGCHPGEEWNPGRDKKATLQLAIPAIPGNDGFKTKEAEKVATPAIAAIQKDELLPAIPSGELKKLKAI